MIGFKSREDFNRTKRAIRDIERLVRQQESNPLLPSVTAQPVTFQIKGEIDENGFYEAVFMYRVNPEVESTSSTSTSNIPTSTSSSTTTEEDRCSTTSSTTTDDPRWYKGETCYIQQLNGRHLGEGCLHNGIIACYYAGYALVVTGEEDPEGTVCEDQPDTPDQPCTGRCKWTWDLSSRTWLKDEADYVINGCCATNNCQCDEPDFCPEVDVLCASVITNCTSRAPIKSPNCKCLDCFNCYCTAKVGTLVSGTNYNISLIACGNVAEDPLYRSVCISCGGCPTATTWDWGEAMTPGEYAYLLEEELGIVCSGVIDGTTSTTTTRDPATSTTSTTTTFGTNCSGCIYRWIPGLGFVRILFGCTGTECKPDCPIPPDPGGPVCQDFHTSCYPKDPPPPPPPVCEGSCEWVSDGTKWIKLNYASRCYNTCTVGACACEPPSIEPGLCSDNAFTPCKCPTDGYEPTTSYVDPDLDDGGFSTSSTTTTEEPCTTTTVSPDCTQGYCWWKWSDEDTYWYYTGRSCPDYCNCNSPIGLGQSDCQVVKTPCGVDPTSTTTTTTETTTTSTTSTTTTLTCETAWCNMFVVDCATDTPAPPYIRLELEARCMTGPTFPPAVDYEGCSHCSGTRYVDISGANCTQYPIGAMYYRAQGCNTTSTTSTTTSPVPCVCLQEGVGDWYGGDCGIIYDILDVNYGNGNCRWIPSELQFCGVLGTSGDCLGCQANETNGCCCTVDLFVPFIYSSCDGDVIDRTFIGNCLSPSSVDPCEWPGDECASVVPEGDGGTTTTSTTSTTTTISPPTTLEGPPPP